MEEKSMQAVPAKPAILNLFDPVQLDAAQRVCKVYASSDLVPESYRVSDKMPMEKAVANCLVALEVASRLNMSPLMIMQNMSVIQGKPSFSSKFLISSINGCGKFERLKYRITNLGKVGKITITEYTKVWTTGQNGRGYYKTEAHEVEFDGSNIDNIECVAYTTRIGSDEIIEGSPVSIEMSVREGWYKKAGSKWQTMPLKMLRYRAASFWQGEHAPEITMGIRTIEENEDIVDTIDVDYEEVKPARKLDIDPTPKRDTPAKPTQECVQPQSPAQPSNTPPLEGTTSQYPEDENPFGF